MSRSNLRLGASEDESDALLGKGFRLQWSFERALAERLKLERLKLM